MTSHSSKLTSFIVLYTILSTAFSAEKSFKVEVGHEAYYETYREYVTRHGHEQRFIKQETPVDALFTKINIPLTDHDQLKLFGRYGYGQMKYTGSNRKDNQYGTLEYRGSPRYMYEMQANYGHTFDYMNLTPYIGAGYRHLTDRNDKVSKGGYRRVSQYMYAIAGIEAKVPLTNSVSLLPKIQYEYVVDAKQYSILKQTTRAYRQHDGYGFDVAMPVEYVLSPQKNAITVTPFYRGWRIADSEVLHGVNKKGRSVQWKEPKNLTHEVGVQVSYTF